MQGKKHNSEQIIKKLRKTDAMLAGEKSIDQICQALEISEQTYHRWRNQYDGMKSDQAKRLKELEDENQRLKKLVAEPTLNKDLLQEALPGNY
jgi:putative transposase